MREVVIVEAVRTPVGKRKGLLSSVRPDDLAGKSIKRISKSCWDFSWTSPRRNLGMCFAD